MDAIRAFIHQMYRISQRNVIVTGDEGSAKLTSIQERAVDLFAQAQLGIGRRTVSRWKADSVSVTLR